MASTDAEVERMLEESIEFAEQDFSQRQLIEARNEAEAILLATDKALAREMAEAPDDLPARNAALWMAQSRHCVKQLRAPPTKTFARSWTF